MARKRAKLSLNEIRKAIRNLEVDSSCEVCHRKPSKMYVSRLGPRCDEHLECIVINLGKYFARPATPVNGLITNHKQK